MTLKLQEQEDQYYQNVQNHNNSLKDIKSEVIIHSFWTALRDHSLMTSHKYGQFLNPYPSLSHSYAQGKWPYVTKCQPPPLPIGYWRDAFMSPVSPVFHTVLKVSWSQS